MDKGVQTAETTNQEGDNSFLGRDSQSRRKPTGRKPRPCIHQGITAASAAGMARKTFPGLNRTFASLPDPRRQDFCKYEATHIWWSGTLMFLTRAGSRNAFDQTRNSGNAPRNMGAFCGQTSDDPRFEGQPLITCSDNVARHLNRVDATLVQEIPVQMCQNLLKQRMFDSARILGCWYAVIFDGTVQEVCRKGFQEGGKSGGKGKARYRYVLQCGLLGPGNTFFPLMHEHMDMQNPETEKEDCEIRAFYRLAKRLKRTFPRMRFCIIGDALYCASTVADVCAEAGWKYVVTLKEGRQPEIWDEVLRLLPLSPGNILRVWKGQDGAEGLRDFRWIEDLSLGRKSCTVVLSGEFMGSEGTLYVYATNFFVSRERVLNIIPATGRERHHIEDYFNTGKNNGVGLGHVFCATSNASKNFFTLMQVAWILWTIICHAYLMRVFDWAAWATEMALARAIGEGMRNHLFPEQLPVCGQLRFVT
jgi:hypothetical protein